MNAFAKSFGPFEFGGGLRGSEHAMSRRAEQVNDASGERGVRSDHRQPDALALDERGEDVMIARRKIPQAPVERRAAVTRRDIDALDPW